MVSFWPFVRIGAYVYGRAHLWLEVSAGSTSGAVDADDCVGDLPAICRPFRL